MRSRQAFCGCGSLRRVSFQSGSRLAHVGQKCFRETAIGQIALPAALQEVGEEAFARCRSLSAVYAEDGCGAALCRTGIPAGAYLGPPRGQLVGQARLDDLRGLSEIVLPEGLELVGNHWFLRCQVKKVVVPASVRSIGAEAFYGCWRLQRLTFAPGSRLKEVGRGSFRGTGLLKVAVPGGVRRLGEGAFENCASLRRVSFPQDAELEEVGDSCFSMTGLRVVAFPGSLRVLGWGAFFGCGALRSVSFGASSRLETVGEQCFGDCGLQRVEVPASVRELCAGAFQGCKALTRLSFQRGGRLERIADACFQSSGLRKVRLPPGLREIGNGAFAFCRGLCRVTFGESLETIGRDDETMGASLDVFQGSALEEVELPASLRRLNMNTFSGCRGLRTLLVAEGCGASLGRVLLSRSVTVGPPRGTGVWAMRRLRELALPDGLERVENHWFWGCLAERVTVSASVVEVGTEAFCKCGRLAAVVFAAGSRLKVLGAGCFRGCGLERVALPARLEEVRECAFYECGLREVSFEAGSGLRLVERYAFSANEGLCRGDVRFPAGADVSDEAFALDSYERLYRKLYRNRRE